MPLTGKQRAQRISRSYHRLPDKNIAWKRLLGLLGLVFGLTYAVWSFTAPGQRQISAGELSQSHAHLFESGCEKCHLPFQPIRFDALWGDDGDIIQKNKNACNGECHKVAEHYASRTQGEILAREGCSRCHQEHLGRNHNLLDVSDANCVRCHRDLSGSSTSRADRFAVATDFSTQHPQFTFANEGENSRNLLFSHIQHMRPGQPKTPGDATAKRLADLKPEDRAKYEQRVDDTGLIQLTCSDCHERDVPVPGVEFMESRDFNGIQNVVIPRSDHRLYTPVDFEKHCVACHSLNDLPHGLNRQQTVDAMQRHLSAVSVEDAERLLAEPSVLSAKMEELIQDRKDRGSVFESNVSDTCRKCHALEPGDSPEIVMASHARTHWLNDATFNHGKHLMMGCIDCHAQAYDQSTAAVDSLTEAKTIMISGLDSCRVCHISDPDLRADTYATNPHVASGNCIDCHRYHVDSPQGTP